MFDSKRFARLAAAHWAEQRKAYAWFIGVGMILHLVLVIINFAGQHAFMSFRTEGQGAMWFMGLFVLAPIFAGRYFQQMARRHSALLVLMRPASVFEKWLLAFVCIAVAYPIAYSAAFYLVNIPAWLVAFGQAQDAFAEGARLKATGLDMQYQYPYRDLKLADFQLFLPMSGKLTWGDLAQSMVMLTSFQAFAVFGSLYFRGAPFIKTLFAAFLVLLAMIFVSTVSGGNGDLMIGYWETDRTLSTLQRVVFPLIWISVPLLLWMSTFLALREREVAP